MKLNKNKKGFSIGEVLLAVFILGTTIITIMNLFSKGIKEMSDSKSSVIAAMLAQEGIELARNARDNNWLDGNDSFDGLTVGDCAGGLNFNGSEYVCSGGRFKRKISVDNAGSNLRLVTSTVVWEGNSFPADSDCNASNKCVFSQAYFSNWGEQEES